MTVALVDGDSLVYRCGFAAEKSYYLVAADGEARATEFDNYKEAKKIADIGNYHIWSRKEIEPLEHCLATVKSSLNKILDITKASELKVYISGKNNFREALYPEYKANREMLGKPKYYRDIRRYMIDNWGADIVNDQEADDIIGIQSMAIKEGSIIVSQDKDLNQIPGKHYNWTNGNFTEVTPQEGMKFFYEQVLSGDSTDNVPGLSGIGPKKAKAAIESAKTPRELAEIARSLYAQDAIGYPPNGEMDLRNGDQHLDLMASLVWIRRKPNDKHPIWRHLGRESV